MRSCMRQLLRGKIHRATVTAAEPDYVGSIVIDQDLLKGRTSGPGRRCWSRTLTTPRASRPTPS